MKSSKLVPIGSEQWNKQTICSCCQNDWISIRLMSKRLKRSTAAKPFLSSNCWALFPSSAFNFLFVHKMVIYTLENLALFTLSQSVSNWVQLNKLTYTVFQKQCFNVDAQILSSWNQFQFLLEASSFTLYFRSCISILTRNYSAT